MENFATFWRVFDLASREAHLKQLETQSADPTLWNSPETAKKLMRELTGLRGRVEEWRGMERRVRDALELAALGDSSMLAELEKEIAEIEAEVARLDLEALLSEPYDEADAFLSIHAGAGGTDSQD